MFVGVVGSSGLGPVVGLPGARPAELIEALRERPDRHALLLTPEHLQTQAREQAHVAIAGIPGQRVHVAALAHHALTLTLLGGLLIELGDEADGWHDPGQAVRVLRRAAASSRSVVWYPKARFVGEIRPTVAQGLGSVLRVPGFFAELDVPGLVSGRHGMGTRPEERWFSSGVVSSVLRAQLGDTPVHETAVELLPPRPYATRGCLELAGLVRPSLVETGGQTCPSCGTSLTTTACAFCGTGPRPLFTVLTPARHGRPSGPSSRELVEERKAS